MWNIPLEAEQLESIKTILLLILNNTPEIIDTLTTVGLGLLLLHHCLERFPQVLTCDIDKYRFYYLVIQTKHH